MRLFDRVCRVVLQGTNTYTLENYDINFEVTKSRLPKDNHARVDIYNLPKHIRKEIINPPAFMQIYAGYSQFTGLSELAQGDIAERRTTQEKADVMTTLVTSEGMNMIHTEGVVLNYDKRVALSTIISDLEKKVSLPIKTVGLDTSVTSTGKEDNGISLYGNIDTVLDNLSLNFDLSWSIQNGVIVLRGINDLKNAPVIKIGKNDGLIVAPENTIKVRKKLLHNISPKGNIYERDRLPIWLLLRPALQVHNIVQVDHDEMKGRFIIEKIKHNGNTKGSSWTTHLEVIPL